MTENDQEQVVTGGGQGEVDTIDVIDRQPANEPQPAPASPAERNLDLVMQIPLSVDVVIGSASMPVSRLMKLGRGSVVALDRKVGEPIDLVVSGRVIARGEVVLLEDGSSRFGISLTEVVQNVNPAGKQETD